ncbi:MAG: hypothetical protein GWN14_04030, partial [candidate division Zixibacteria bacterium]|nr:hypothetical protein [candidate division Zixibacteria bacterium]
MAENQILLLPRINYYQWARSVQKFALHFGVGITSDPAKAGDYNIVTVATAPNSYPHEGDIVEWLKQRFPGVNIDLIKVESPENLSRMLDQRIERGIRYHKLLG